jgi:protoporphyrinogen oxidase
MVRKTDDKSWGPNNTFRFPRYGGTGAIWKKMGAALAASLPEGTFRLDSEVTSVSVDSKTLHLSTGETVKYDHLITTMPMDILLKVRSGYLFAACIQCLLLEPLCRR